MFLAFEDRPSDSPYVDRVWRCHSARAGTLLSVAATHCELVLTRHRGRLRVTLRGPETRPSPIDCPAEAEWIGIRLATGTWLPRHPAASLRDRQDLDLPLADPPHLLARRLRLGAPHLRQRRGAGRPPVAGRPAGARPRRRRRAGR